MTHLTPNEERKRNEGIILPQMDKEALNKFIDKRDSSPQSELSWEKAWKKLSKGCNLGGKADQRIKGFIELFFIHKESLREKIQKLQVWSIGLHPTMGEMKHNFIEKDKLLSLLDNTER